MRAPGAVLADEVATDRACEGETAGAGGTEPRDAEPGATESRDVEPEGARPGADESVGTSDSSTYTLAGASVLLLRGLRWPTPWSAEALRIPELSVKPAAPASSVSEAVVATVMDLRQSMGVSFAEPT